MNLQQVVCISFTNQLRLVMCSWMCTVFKTENMAIHLNKGASHKQT